MYINTIKFKYPYLKCIFYRQHITKSFLKSILPLSPIIVLSHFCRVQLFAILWTVARQAPLSMGFPSQEYWSGLPFPPPGDLPDPGIEPMSPALAGGFFTSEPPGKPQGMNRSLPSG